MQKSVAEIQAIIAEKIPDGLIVPRHDSEGHKYEYTPSGIVYPSVTTRLEVVNNPHLKRWAARIAIEYIDRNWDIVPQNREAHYKAATLAHEDELKDAGGIGTQGHQVIEDYMRVWLKSGVRPADIRTFIYGEDSRLWAITRSCEQFLTDFEVIPIASELLVASVKYGFAGTLDSLLMVKKGDKYVFAIGDWKSSNDIHKHEYAMQVAAYYRALFELTGLRPEELLIVRLDKERMKYEVLRVTDRPAAFRAFMHASKLYDYMNGTKSTLYPFNAKKEVFMT